jgi:alpha-beta hydrolase superfamily lysophospholipase
MPNAIARPVRPDLGAPSPLPARVRRTPFYFESQGQSLFAWLHHAEPRPPAGHGVLICPPVGHEQVHAHRSLRHLAEGLAGAGFSVLRFDYHGTGDSGGTDEDPDLVATWLANIRDARQWLAQHVGCRRVSLIGLRLGATLAAQVAAGLAVDGLLLWAPVVKGRSYVREMKALSLTAAAGSPQRAPPSADIEAGGFVLTEQTARDVSRLNLLQCRPLCRRALILTRDDTPAETQLVERLRALGIDAQEATRPGYAAMMAEPHFSQVPRAAIACAVDWLRAAASPEDRAGEEGNRDEARPAAAPVARPPSVGYVFLSQQAVRERAFPIHQQPHLFGIVSEPAEAAAEGLPFIVLVNAGSAHRVGPNRLYVFLARQLAARGFGCLRMDLCGLGDSVCTDPQRENDPYPATAFRDLGLALQHLRARLGVRRVVLMGLCSGAYAAFQAAAQLSDPVLVESVLINPLTFYWREGMKLGASAATRIQVFRECLAAAGQPRKWLKLLTGRSKLGIGGALRVLLERWRLRQPPASEPPLPRHDTPCDTFPSHPVRDDLPGDLARVTRAGRYLACFFARNDSGYGVLTLYAGREVNDLRRAGKMSLCLLDGADHTFSRRAPRRALAEAIAAHLVRRYVPSAE